MLFLILQKLSFSEKIGGFCLVLGLLLNSCAYRFSNLEVKIPAGVRTIAVEAIYDVSREVIPHEFLWTAVQRELGKSGRLIVTGQDKADAIVLITLKGANISPTGTPSREPLSRDPSGEAGAKGKPEEYRNIKRAGNWTTDEAVSMTINVEIYDLRTRTLLFKRDYSQATNFKSLRSVTITPGSSGFLNYEEALSAKVKQVSEQLATQIVTDFLI